MKKAYSFQMKILPANILAIIIFVIAIAFTFPITPIFFEGKELFVALILMFVWFILHELLHGIGFRLGGSKTENIRYGIALEKGILYTMCMEEISKKNILISLILPFIGLTIITYVIGVIITSKLLLFLSIINFMGASLDLVMFIYLLKIKEFTYSETSEPDEFVIITKEDLTKKKSLFLKIIEEKKYNKKDYIFEKGKKITISKDSRIIFVILVLLFLLALL